MAYGGYGDAINNCFRSKNIDDVGCPSGEWNEKEFNTFVLKEPDYNIMMMLTFSGLTVPESQNEERRMVNWEIVKFQYPEVVADHYRYRGAVENHNALSHDNGTKSQSFLESKWGMIWWSIQVFAFFVA